VVTAVLKVEVADQEGGHRPGWPSTSRPTRTDADAGLHDFRVDQGLVVNDDGSVSVEDI
jgi:hypothetical protein